MAFGAKHATLVKDYDLILPFDPALNAEGEDFQGRYQKYRETGDVSHLPKKAGQEPTVWKMGHIRGEAAQELLDELGRVPREDLQRGALPRRLQYRAARLAIKGWSNLLNDEGGEVQPPNRVPGPGGHVMLREEDLDWLASLTESQGQIPLSLGVVALEKLTLPLSS